MMLDTCFGAKWSRIQILTACDPGKPVDFTEPLFPLLKMTVIPPSLL